MALGNVPSIINGDESGSILQPTQIILNKNESIFSLTHDGNISYIVYAPKALMMSWLADKYGVLFSVRLVTVLFSIGTIACFYLLARNYFSEITSLLITILLASSYWFINFSRISWICMDSIFFGLLGLVVLEKIKKTGKLVYFLLEGVILAFILYNYMGGRIYFAAISISLVWEILRHRQKRFGIGYLGILMAVSILLYLPQLKMIVLNLGTFLTRPKSVFVFNTDSDYYDISPKNKIDILKHQVEYSLKGFFLFDKRVSSEGIENQRYIPNGKPAVNLMVKWFFWIGIAVMFLRKKIIYSWVLLYFLNIVFLQLPTVLIPSWSRAIGVLPIIYLVAAFSIEEVVKFMGKLKQKNIFLVGLSVLIVLVAIGDVKTYFTWVNSPDFYSANQPNISINELDAWYKEEYRTIKDGDLPFTYYDWYEKSEL
jgi:4-amino-4-deoxy-L-arabinose transferase-like glycosyltransferase